MLHDPTNPGLWLDGSPRSLNNGFTRGLGEPINWASFNTGHLLTQAQSKRVDRARAEGDSSGTIARISKRGAQMTEANGAYWHGKVLKKAHNSVSIEPASNREAKADKRQKLKRAAI